MIAEQREREGDAPTPLPPPVAPPPPPAAPVDERPLPKLDELVARLSPELRETLEELFRARFTSVQRVPPAALKS